VAKLAKWQERYLECLPKMSNGELLNEVIEGASGDSYDGNFTVRGWWQYKTAKFALYDRLYAAGFITAEDCKNMQDNIG